MRFRFFPLCAPPVFRGRVRAPGAVLAAGVVGIMARGAAAAPVPVVEAARHRATLQRAEADLRALEVADVSRRAAKSIARGLAGPLTVRRRDGATQPAGGDEWTRRIGEMRANPSRQDVRALRQAVTLRRVALEEWMTPQGGGSGDAVGDGYDSYYEPADAQRIVRSLENTGQIRVGPTRLEQLWDDIKKGFDRLIDRIARWLFGAAPSAPTSVPDIDPRWITFFFYSTVLSLLALIGYFLWKALGGRWTRQGARREVRFSGGEDDELLVLPPEELRERAARLAAEGDFRGALRHLYIALLLELDARGVWRYDARRTNWEHVGALRQIARNAAANGNAANGNAANGNAANGNATGSANALLAAALVEPLSDITRRFDRVRYGDAPASQDDWMRFARDVGALEKTVAGVATNVTPGAAMPSTNGSDGAAMPSPNAATGSSR